MWRSTTDGPTEHEKSVRSFGGALVAVMVVTAFAAPGIAWAARVTPAGRPTSWPRTGHGSPKDFDVPGVTGQPFSEARVTLWRAGFRVRRVDDSSAVVAGFVGKQDPAAGFRVASGSTVTLNVGTRDARHAADAVNISQSDDLAGFAVGDGAAWASHFKGASITRVDGTNLATTEIPTGDLASVGSRIVVGNDAVWATGRNGLIRVDVPSLAVTNVDAGSSPTSTVITGDAVWVVNFQADSVTRVDRSTNTATTVSVPGAEDIGGAGCCIWVSRKDGQLTRIDLPGLATSTVKIGPTPRVSPNLGTDIHSSGSTLWIERSDDSGIICVDTSTQVIHHYRDLGTGRFVPFADGAFFIGTSSVTRIDHCGQTPTEKRLSREAARRLTQLFTFDHTEYVYAAGGLWFGAELRRSNGAPDDSAAMLVRIGAADGSVRTYPLGRGVQTQLNGSGVPVAFGGGAIWLEGIRAVSRLVIAAR
jgi:PASTA domain